MCLSAVKNKNYTVGFFFFFSFIFVSCSEQQNSYKKIQGNVFGTTFHITYEGSSQRDFRKEVASLFNSFNKSLSTYHSTSTISKLNNGKKSTEVDTYFKHVFVLSKKIHNKTNGYFDPTIGKMVNAWGFGPEKIKSTPTNNQVDSLMQYVGLDKVKLENNQVVKDNKNIYLDFNAIAKGYGVDVVTNFLESREIANYLVEIGGEIRAKGVNAKNKRWSVGIENPNLDGTRSITKITTLDNESMATSGNYRKYKIDEVTGSKIAHTLNPKTGFPAKTNLLSVSVIGKMTCGEVDAYATSFMAMGFKSAKKMVLKNKKIKVFFIYLENDVLKTYTSSNLTFVD